MKCPAPWCLALALVAPASVPALECPGALLGELTEGPIHSLALTSGYLYVGSGATLLVYSLADPTNPVRTAAIPLSDVTEQIDLAGKLLVVTTGTAISFWTCSACLRSWPAPRPRMVKADLERGTDQARRER